MNKTRSILNLTCFVYEFMAKKRSRSHRHTHTHTHRQYSCMLLNTVKCVERIESQEIGRFERFEDWERTMRNLRVREVNEITFWLVFRIHNRMCCILVNLYDILTACKWSVTAFCILTTGFYRVAGKLRMWKANGKYCHLRMNFKTG